MSSAFMTLLELPEAKWPPGLVTYPPRSYLEGDRPRVLCPQCKCPVLFEEMLVFTAIPAKTQRQLGLRRAIICTYCFHLDAARGLHLPSAVAKAAKLHPDTVAALEEGDHRCVHHGQFKTTAKNKHLLRRALPASQLPE